MLSSTVGKVWHGRVQAAIYPPSASHKVFRKAAIVVLYAIGRRARQVAVRVATAKNGHKRSKRGSVLMCSCFRQFERRAARRSRRRRAVACRTPIRPCFAPHIARLCHGNSMPMIYRIGYGQTRHAEPAERCLTPLDRDPNQRTARASRGVVFCPPFAAPAPGSSSERSTRLARCRVG